MRKIFKNFSIPAIAGILILSTACSSGTAATGGATTSRPVTIQRGSLSVTVSVDGSLNMPNNFDLHFGAPGNVKDIFVKEGDFVKAGTIMATLDDTQQALAIRSANNSVQSDLSNLYETVPRLPQFQANVAYYPAVDPLTGKTAWADVPLSDPLKNVDPASPAYGQLSNLIGLQLPVGFPSYYPSEAALIAYGWAQNEIELANNMFQSGDYSSAASRLYIALSDLDSCAQIMLDAVNNPQSGLGNMAPFVPDDSQYTVSPELILEQPAQVPLIVELRGVVKLINQYRQDVQTVMNLTKQGQYDEAGSQFQTILDSAGKVGSAVAQNVNFIKTNGNTDIYGRSICNYFFQAATKKLDLAKKGLENGGVNSTDLAINLVLAEHDMQLCNAILGTNDYVLQHGLSMQAQQNNNLKLASDLVNLRDRQLDFINTAILAPVDGIVTLVNVKKNDVLSNIDYASKGDIKMVDTTQIEFKGTVDEIDITKIKAGQRASISVDAVPNKTFPGTVSFISPFGTPDSNNVVKFNITVVLDPTDIALKGQLTATAEVSVSTAENVLLVPLAAVTTGANGVTTVNLLDTTTGKPEKRTITLGSKSLQMAEVLTGLKEGDKIVIEEKTTGAPISTRPPGSGGGGPPPGR